MIIDKSHPCSTEIYSKDKYRRVEYIVIHFTGDGGVPAKNYAKCNQYNNAHRDASWHYCVGDHTENYKIYQSVEDKDVAWHCGANRYKHPKCRNSNSIGIEHCCYWKNGKAYFEEGTLKVSAELVASLMKKYNIPLSNVIRHYDVTGKECPKPFLYGDGQWENYLKMVQKAYDSINSSDNDEELENAVDDIIKSGIKINASQWNDVTKIKLQYVPALLTKLGGLDKLIEKGIISDATLWKQKKYNVNHVRSLIIKYSKTL